MLLSLQQKECIRSVRPMCLTFNSNQPFPNVFLTLKIGYKMETSWFKDHSTHQHSTQKAEEPSLCFVRSWSQVSANWTLEEQMIKTFPGLKADKTNKTNVILFGHVQHSKCLALWNSSTVMSGFALSFFDSTWNISFC